jgi:type I restriction enzyme S subunit
MTRIGDIGTSKYISWSPKASFYVSLALIKRVGLINMKFLDQYIKSDLIQHELWRRTIHVAFPKKINLCEIGECRITTPKEKEQQKIADFLTTVDEKIEKLEAKKKAFEKYKKGVMQAIFNQKIRFKKPDGSNYPDWEEKKLGDLFHEQTERKADKKFELLSVTTNNGITKQTSSNKRDNSSADTSNYKVVNVGDIVYNTMRMWQGASGISDFNGYVSPAYTVIRLVDGSANFFQYLFKQPRVIFNFFRYSQGLTSDTWNLKFHHFSTVEVTIPTNTTEQEKIAEFLTALDNKINLINNQLEQAKLFKKSLLQRMFV